MTLLEIIQSQYLAALAMLKQAIVQCPDSLWDDPEDKNKFWHVAYHTLFYTHLYLQPAESDFVLWAKGRENYQFMGTLPWAPDEKVKVERPYQKTELLDYLALCQAEVQEKVVILNLDAAESGFDWIPLNKLELQFYNIRHAQHHIGELCDRLGHRAGIDIDWVGRQHEAK